MAEAGCDGASAPSKSERLVPVPQLTIGTDEELMAALNETPIAALGG